MKNILTTAMIVAITASFAHAEEKTLYVAGSGGSTEALFKENIIPKWEQQNNTKVVYISGNSTDTLAKLRAQAGAQQIDIAMIDDGPMTQAIQFGYCAPVKSETFKDLYASAKLPEDKAVGIGFIATGLVYNTKMFADKGWAAPTSWRDLADPKYKGLISIPPITNGYGLHALIMEAKINGGGENNIEPGFKVFESEINQNVLAYEPSPGKMSELFQNGEIALAVWGSGRVKSLADTGFPVSFVYPKEGAVSLLTAACPVTGSKLPDLAQNFIGYITSPDVQNLLVKALGYGPVNEKVVVPDNEIGALPVGAERVNSMVTIDYSVVNKARGDWTKEWTRRVER
ncbi:ABC transporter substrate-binding protein [Agrobacterium vitis]|uniref:ABC transporter substrate-binding protein n=1 Tax=Allorhizobium ampelinum TaxID=3025782 RepID=UPI001F318298|nr:ABC transporter substrate-binding protein [Allorhizobium ampelinum]MCF1461153.1 ABC transporter substrate-binding protein [Allorhizobium ampelinum]